MSSEANAVWNECLRVIEQHVNEQSFSTWFKPINPVKLEGTSLTIQVPSQFFYEWLEDNYIQELKLAIKTVLGQGGRLEYAVVVDRGNSSNQPYVVSYPQGNHGNKKQGNQANSATEQKVTPFEMQSLGAEALTQSNLNPNYTFNTYIEGDCNRLARSAGFAVATKPGITSFNPLMVYGGVGLGKTR
nr:chromosomal replication initiator protein DnaA [Algoriphagus sp.]